MVNQTNVLALAEFIETRKDLGFNMNLSRGPLSRRTCGCIGAFAATLWPEIRYEYWNGEWTWENERLIEMLGISPTVHADLCFPEFLEEKRFATREQAVITLHRLAETGVVNWPDLS